MQMFKHGTTERHVIMVSPDRAGPRHFRRPTFHAVQPPHQLLNTAQHNCGPSHQVMQVRSLRHAAHISDQPYRDQCHNIGQILRSKVRAPPRLVNKVLGHC
jgi:hypothetical protein